MLIKHICSASMQDVGSLDWTRISEEVAMELGEEQVGLEVSDLVNLETFLTSLVSVSLFA